MQHASDPDRLVITREATYLLGICRSTLYKLCREGKLTPVKFGRRCTRYKLSEIQGLIAQGSSVEVA